MPVWLFALAAILGGVFVVVFSWAAVSAAGGSGQAGLFGRGALAVARLPTLAAQVADELTGRATGEIETAYIRVERRWTDLAGFAPPAGADAFGLEGLLLRGDGAAPGWRLLTGAFVIDGAARNAAVLLRPDLSVASVRRLGQDGVAGAEPQEPFRTFVHGAALSRDGALSFVFDNGDTLQRVDACGRRLWARGGRFHHAVSEAPGGASLWTFRATPSGRSEVVEVAAADGKTLRSFSFDDVIRANPGIDILAIRAVHATRLGENPRNTEVRWLEDPHHMNDVDPLTPERAAAFAQFDVGDLLISARSLNLVFVLDPDDLRVKWWRVGATQRQHDPDWGADGAIVVYNNRMGADYSEILAIDPTNFSVTTRLDGRLHDFYSRIRGKQTALPGGGFALASPQQGWAFETDAAGARRLDAVSIDPTDDTLAFGISDLIWMPPEALSDQEVTCPS